MTVRPPVALSIGGSDSCCGAGIQADLKAFQYVGVYGVTVLTAVTSQNTGGVSGVFPLPPEVIAGQFDAVLSDLKPASIKTGMLVNSELVELVSGKISGMDNIVVDPVMVSETGRRLLSEDAVKALKKELLPLAALVTPNVYEAEVLSGVRISSVEDAKRAARKIPARSVIVKGGHLPSKMDVLYHNKKTTLLKPSFISGGRMHGRGCCFSAAVAGGLAKGLGLPDAVLDAKSAVDSAILNQAQVGSGLPVANFDSPERVWLKRDIESAVSALSTTRFRLLLPEVGSNLVSLLPGARSSADVAGIDGRIRKSKEGIIFAGAGFGVSTHMASALLAAHSLCPRISSALNVLYTPAVFTACRKAGLSTGISDRKDEPERVRDSDGASMPWAVRSVFEQQGEFPDVIYHTGSFGKEPMLLVFGDGPQAIVLKVNRILEMLK